MKNGVNPLNIFVEQIHVIPLDHYVVQRDHDLLNALNSAARISAR